VQEECGKCERRQTYLSFSKEGLVTLYKDVRIRSVIKGALQLPPQQLKNCHKASVKQDYKRKAVHPTNCHRQRQAIGFDQTQMVRAKNTDLRGDVVK
jgi:hypothetical protein